MKKDDGLTIEEAILVIESLLNLNGVAITGLGDSEVFRVLPAAGINVQSLISRLLIKLLRYLKSEGLQYIF